jgi:aminoglycoside 6'-N-acetyltransferase I
MIIRHVAPADARTWLCLRCNLWPEGSEPDHASDIAAFFEGRAREPVAVLIAEDDAGSVLGFIELSVRDYAEGCDSDRVAYVEGWYVIPEARRRGVGRALITAAEEWARSRGFTEMASDAELTNDVSAAAHQALGFTEVNRVRCFRKDL